MGDLDRLPYEQAFARIRADFLEMPCLRLSAAQVATLCGIDRRTCETVLTDLSRAGILHCGPDGTYTRGADDVKARVRGDRRQRDRYFEVPPAVPL
jgi:hypothetical protein